MSNLDRRIGRLEEKFGVDREPRLVIITINPNNLPENPYRVELFPGGLWAYAIRGGPFTEEEIRELREEHTRSPRHAETRNESRTTGAPHGN